MDGGQSLHGFPGKWKPGLKFLRSRSWWFNFDPYAAPMAVFVETAGQWLGHLPNVCPFLFCLRFANGLDTSKQYVLFSFFLEVPKRAMAGKPTQLSSFWRLGAALAPSARPRPGAARRRRIRRPVWGWLSWRKRRKGPWVPQFFIHSFRSYWTVFVGLPEFLDVLFWVWTMLVANNNV